MKYFIVLGTLTSKEPVGEALMEQHIAHAKKAIEDGTILLTGLKEDISGGILFMKARSREEIETYIETEPMKQKGLQEYQIIEFTPHYVNEAPSEWIVKE